MNLPIDAVLPAVLDAARERPVVLRAATGAGKTTRVPPALAERGRVLVLEPRRVATRAAARRIAEERGWTLGTDVGWIVRGERRAGPDARVTVVTDGVFLRMIQDDPELSRYAAVVVDELHERGLGVDLATALLRQVRGELRPDLAVVVMSATLDADAVGAWLDGAVIDCPGRTFPLEIRYGRRPDDVPAGVARAAREALDHPGDVLCFLPGVREIRETAALLRDAPARVLPLYGDLPGADQDAVLRPGGGRKIVLATNVAETSVTVPGVTSVVDSGLARVLRQDPATGLDRLLLERISRASADQRAGRAGRESPGVVWRLWTEREHAELAAWTEPEVRRVDLAGAVLELMCWGEADPAAFPWLEAPPAHALAHAAAVLGDLGALAGGRLTPLGRELAAFGAHPRLARLIVEGRRRGAGDDAALLAAVLQEGDRAPGTRDVAELVRDASPAARALARAWQTGGRGSAEDLDRAVLAAWPDRVARRRDDPHTARLAGGRGIRVLGEHPAPAWFAAVVVDGGARGTTDGVARVIAPIDPAWLPAETREETAYDPVTDRVATARITAYRDLVLASTPRPLDVGEAARVLAAAARVPAALPGSPAFVQRRARQAFAARFDASVPAPDDAWLAGLLPVVARGARSLADLRAADWIGAMDEALPWAARQRLDTLAPEHLTVPTGNRIRLDWTGDRPALDVRIQELFGQATTPRVAGQPVLLRLLAPNGRPQQITDDLDGFWDRTWPEVRKELRARYPRHSWPEDPRAAAPEARPRRKTPRS